MKEPRLVCVLAAFLVAQGAVAADGDGCRQSKDLNGAIAACTEAIRANPKDSRLLAERGFLYFRKFDYDRAFADYEAAIQLNPAEAVAYRNRGMIFQVKGDDDRAIADFTKAIELGSKDPMVLTDRGIAHAAKGEATQAIEDYGAALRQDPNNPSPYMLLGIAHTYGGALDQAQADFKRGFEADPKFPYFAIWLHIAERRANKPSTLASVVPKLDMSRWPAQVVRMFLGEEQPAAVLARGTANISNPYGACESDFFVAEYRYLQGQRDEAIRLYKSARQSCRRNFFEWVAADAALRLLEAK